MTTTTIDETAGSATLRALDDVRAALPRLQRAITLRDSDGAQADFVRGGMPSWEPIKLAALAVMQDVRREVDELDELLRLALGLRWHRARDLDTALTLLAVAVAAAARRAESVPELAEVRRGVSVWAVRAALVLRDVRAPYALLWPDGTRVLCPTTLWAMIGEATIATACPGELWVHRDPESGVPNVIKCKRDPEHAWASGPAWLRLGVALGGVV